MKQYVHSGGTCKGWFNSPLKHNSKNIEIYKLFKIFLTKVDYTDDQ